MPEDYKTIHSVDVGRYEGGVNIGNAKTIEYATNAVLDKLEPEAKHKEKTQDVLNLLG